MALWQFLLGYLTGGAIGFVVWMLIWYFQRRDPPERNRGVDRRQGP